MSHLAHETVVALLEGRLSEDETARVDDHVDECATCRSLLAEVAKSSTIVAKGSTGSTVPDDVEPLDDGPDGNLRAFFPGQVISKRFRVVRKLGRGAMGVVYEALDEQLGVRVALKVLPPHATRNTRLLERLRQEVILGRRITHPNVCRVYDMGFDGSIHYISMEYLEGETLEMRMRRGPLSFHDAWVVLNQIGEALEVAHAHGVVHRDLKPSNIMVGSTGKVTVMDFGLARDLRAERSEAGVAIGTPAYWAPEQARGEKATVRSDLYSLAVIFCELLFGKRPAWSERPNLEGVPDVYKPIFTRSLKLDPSERFGSVREVREAIREARERAHPKPRRPYKRRFIVAAGIGGILGGAALAVAALVAAGRASIGVRARTVSIEVVPPTAGIYRESRLLGRGAVDLEVDEDGAPFEIHVEQHGFESATRTVGPDSARVIRVDLAPSSR